jgi:hypothetical protein
MQKNLEKSLVVAEGGEGVEDGGGRGVGPGGGGERQVLGRGRDFLLFVGVFLVLLFFW